MNQNNVYYYEFSFRIIGDEIDDSVVAAADREEYTVGVIDILFNESAEPTPFKELEGKVWKGKASFEVREKISPEDRDTIVREVLSLFQESFPNSKCRYCGFKEGVQSKTFEINIDCDLETETKKDLMSARSPADRNKKIREIEKRRKAALGSNMVGFKINGEDFSASYSRLLLIHIDDHEAYDNPNEAIIETTHHFHDSIKKELNGLKPIKGRITTEQNARWDVIDRDKTYMTVDLNKAT